MKSSLFSIRVADLPPSHSRSMPGTSPPAGKLQLATLHRPLCPGTLPKETACEGEARLVDLDHESIWISYSPLPNPGEEPHPLGCTKRGMESSQTWCFPLTSTGGTTSPHQSGSMSITAWRTAALVSPGWICRSNFPRGRRALEVEIDGDWGDHPMANGWETQLL